MAVTYNKVEKTMKGYFKTDSQKYDTQVNEFTFNFIC